MVDGRYIVRVIAENNKGEFIAISRGIDLDENLIYRYPKEWRYFNEYKGI
jgi:hypothetical protein